MEILKLNEYGAFYQPYIDALADNDLSLLDYLAYADKQTQELLSNLNKDKQDYRYAKNKWSVKEIVQHLIDAERILTYRALRFARQDNTELSGYNEDDYVANSFCQGKNFEALLIEIKVLRQSSILLFKGFSEEVLQTIGKANGSKMSVRAIGYIISGHQLHHLKVIKEWYL